MRWDNTCLCIRADDVILNRPGQNTKVLTTCSHDTVDREIFARKNFRLLNVCVVLFRRFGKCRSAGHSYYSM